MHITMLQEIYDTHSKNIKKYIKNGMYFPLLKIVLFLATGDIFLSTIIIQKAYVANYYYNFEHLYHYVPHPYNWVKQFIRYTDTGHIASFLYYFFPQYIGIAHNVHFTISFAYWFARIIFNMEDRDSKKDDEVIDWFANMWTVSNHGLVYLLILYRVICLPVDTIHYDPFSQNDLMYSYMWFYAWAFFIYLPWRFFTGDPVYSVIAYQSPWSHQIITFLAMNALMYLGNSIGYFITH